MNDVFAEKALAVTILLLMFVPALPLPTGGVTHVFELITVLLAAQMVLGRRTIWLPERWRRRDLGAATTEKAILFIVRRVRQVERFSRPRGPWLFEQHWMDRLLGLTLIVFAVGGGDRAAVLRARHASGSGRGHRRAFDRPSGRGSSSRSASSSGQEA